MIIFFRIRTFVGEQVTRKSVMVDPLMTSRRAIYPVAELTRRWMLSIQISYLCLLVICIICICILHITITITRHTLFLKLEFQPKNATIRSGIASLNGPWFFNFENFNGYFLKVTVDFSKNGKTATDTYSFSNAQLANSYLKLGSMVV